MMELLRTFCPNLWCLLIALKEGVIRYKNRIWVGPDSKLQTRIIAAIHESAIGGHSGAPVTLRKLKQLFAWKGMNTTVHTFVAHYQTCLQAKLDRVAYPGMPQPLPVSSSAWHTISMDFIEGLPKSGSVSCILVVVHLFLSMLILSLYHITIQLHQWPLFLWSMCTSYMVCQPLLCLTVTRCLQADFGSSCLLSVAQH